MKTLGAASTTSYGFQPYLKASGKRGTFVRWEDAELSAAQQLQSAVEEWKSEEQIVKPMVGQKDDWGIEKQTRKQIAEEFEKW
jgi:hypothetical protein